MNELLQQIQFLKHSNIGNQVNKRTQEFKAVNKHSTNDLFKELCFCILTANFNAERGIHIHQQLSACFQFDTKEALERKLRTCGYRFPHTRAAYITEAASYKDELQTKILMLSGEELRSWLVKSIKGLGYKEASHFLRNIGFDDYAIIDSHILDVLQRYHVMTKPKTLTKKKYIEIEKILRDIAQQADLTLAELDLFLWYMETGKILK